MMELLHIYEAQSPQIGQESLIEKAQPNQFDQHFIDIVIVKLFTRQFCR